MSNELDLHTLIVFCQSHTVPNSVYAVIGLYTVTTPSQSGNEVQDLA